MFTLKLYAKTGVILTLLDPITILDPKSETWEETLAEMERQAGTALPEPWRIIKGISRLKVEEMLPVFDGEQCYICNEEGKTIETIRQPKREVDNA